MQLSDSTFDELTDRALSIYHQAAEEWLADDPAYARLRRLASDDSLQLCVSCDPQPRSEEWQDVGVLPDDVAEQELVACTLFYAAADDDEHQVQEIIVKMLLSAQEDNDFCALQWFPD